MDVRYRVRLTKEWREARRRRMSIQRSIWVKSQFKWIDWGDLIKIQKECQDLRERLFEDKFSDWERQMWIDLIRGSK